MELKDPDFHGRLGLIIGDEKPFKWAAKVGISSGAFSRVWNEGTVPSPDKLRDISRHTGVSIDWLLTGEGPIKRGEAAAPAPVAEPAFQTAPNPMNGQMDQDYKISTLLAKTAAVLESDTIYRVALASNINAFHQAVSGEEKMARMEKQMESMQAELKEIRETLRQYATVQAKDEPRKQAVNQ